MNEFSLHTFYRNRLVRCFLGASRKRTPHPFTGFDDEDDLPLAALAATAPHGHIRPYPIFNAVDQSCRRQEPGLAGAQGGFVRVHA